MRRAICPAASPSVKETEAKQADGIDGIQLEIPLFSCQNLVADREGGIEKFSIPEENGRIFLHFYDDGFIACCLAIDIEHAIPSHFHRIQLLWFEELQITDTVLPRQADNGVEKINEELLVRLSVEDAVNAKDCERVDVVF